MSEPRRMTVAEVEDAMTRIDWLADMAHVTWADSDLIGEVADELRAARASEDAKDKEIARLKADNAELARHAKNAAVLVRRWWTEPIKDDDTPERAEAFLSASDALTDEARPGAAILEELTRLRAQVATLIQGQRRNGEARQQARLDMAHELAEMEPPARDAAIRRVIDSHEDKP